jgi:hypothetical protein
MNNEKRRDLSKHFDHLGAFVDGLALAEKSEKFFHINELGKPIYKERYDYATDFSEGFAVVAEGEKYFFINKDGKKLFKTHFSDVINFEDGIALICIENDKWAKINISGKVVSRWFDGNEIF